MCRDACADIYSATDSKHWRYRGVPAYSYGLSPEGQAGKDENASVEDFIKLIKIHAGAAWDWWHEGC
jgi:succinyl-diaminopimelate desuccinylase